LAFIPRNRSVPRPPRAAVIAIGQRVFINCPGNRTGSVALADESGAVVSDVHLADGVEVEVIAWRPRGASDTRYRVRSASNADGWLPCVNLRKVGVPAPAPEPTTESAPSDDPARPFGQRAHLQQPHVSQSPPPAQPAPPSPASDARGRRFGQHF
jgi:hypothetical protein